MQELRQRKSKKGTWGQAFGSLSFAILLVLSIRWLLIEAYVIPSGSMFPTLLVNDHIFVNKLAYGVRFPFSKKWIFKYREVERGDVVVFRYVHDTDIFYVKRVIGVGGDHIKYDGRSRLEVNGKMWPRELVTEKARVEKNEEISLSDFPGLELYRQ